MSESPGSEDSLNALVIIALRIYDALMLANANSNPEATEALRLEHEAGNFIGPPPTLSKDPFGLDEE